METGLITERKEITTMNKFMLIAATVTASFSLFAGSALLKGYKQNDFAALCSENFNSGAPGWKLPKEFSVNNKDGILGTAALHGISKKNSIPSAVFPIKIKPGATYRISFQYRVKNFQLKDKTKNRMSIFLCSIGYTDNSGKKAHKHFRDTKFNASESWKKFYTTIKMPDNIKEDALLKFNFDWWHTGEVWYDEILVESADMNSAIIPVKPYNSALGKDGKIAFQTYFYTKDHPSYKDLKLYMNINGSERIVDADKNLRFETQITPPAQTYFPVTVKLLDSAKKEILAEHTCRFSTVPKSNKVGTRLDEKGRTILNGKKVLPIGFFTYQFMGEEDYKRISAAGFNFVSFGINFRNLQSVSSNSPEKLRAMLDLLKKYDLQGILQLVQMVPGKEKLRRQYEKVFGNETTAKGIVRLVGETLKDHPNLLAYYLSDENPRLELPDVRANRELLAAVDPNHISLTLTNNSENFTVFAPTADVLVYDIYPFGSRADHDPGKNDLLSADESFRMLQDMRIPWWLCGQAYDRGIYRGKTNEKMPEERQLSALTLLGAIYGAKGFYYFSYHGIFEKASRVDPNHHVKMWPRVAESGKLLKMLTPYILSDKTAPEMKIINRKNIVRGKRFIADNGKEAVVLVSIHAKPVEATFELPAGKKYRSLRGKAVQTGKGTWKFSSDNVDYDILTEE